MEISTKTIVKNTIENIEIPDSPDLKKWFKEFEEMSSFDKTRIITELNKSQSVYVKDSMSKLKNPIPLYILGKFYYKESRKQFYDIKEANPDMSLSEILNKLKEEHKKRYTRRNKLKKSKDIRLKL